MLLSSSPFKVKFEFAISSQVTLGKFGICYKRMWKEFVKPRGSQSVGIVSSEPAISGLVDDSSSFNPDIVPLYIDFYFILFFKSSPGIPF